MIELDSTMNISSYVPKVYHRIFQLSSQLSLRGIWDCYVQYLWNYEPNSWVGRIASLSRVLAILISLPIVVLALLVRCRSAVLIWYPTLSCFQDISSYGIARTLGVIDDVKASTSDIATVHQNITTSSIVRIQEPGTPLSDSSHPYSDQSDTEHTRHIQSQRQLSHLGVSQPSTFFASEDHNLKLSGVGVFSPATSRAPSPTISRKNLLSDSRGSTQEDGLHLKQRIKQNASGE
jgi:hypothetical protein